MSTILWIFNTFMELWHGGRQWNGQWISSGDWFNHAFALGFLALVGLVVWFIWAVLVLIFDSTLNRVSTWNKATLNIIKVTHHNSSTSLWPNGNGGFTTEFHPQHWTYRGAIDSNIGGLAVELDSEEKFDDKTKPILYGFRRISGKLVAKWEE